MQPIVLYDLAGKEPGQNHSLATAKARYALGFKGLEYTTVRVEIDEIDSALVKLGAPGVGKRADGRDRHVLPTIVDPNTSSRTIFSDSLLIAEYLDRAYPSPSKLVPAECKVLYQTFVYTLDQLAQPWDPYLWVRCIEIMSPRSAETFRKFCTSSSGLAWEEISPEGSERRETHKKALKKMWDEVDAWYAMSPGMWAMGEQFTFADLEVVGWLKSLQHSMQAQEWDEICQWNGGRWKKMVDRLEKYYKAD